MSATKPKPRKPAPRKAAVPTLAERLRDVEQTLDLMMLDVVQAPRDIHAIERRLDALETRSRYRDASHDEPVSNASEIPPRETAQPSIWRRFLAFMRSP